MEVCTIVFLKLWHNQLRNFNVFREVTTLCLKFGNNFIVLGQEWLRLRLLILFFLSFLFFRCLYFDQFAYVDTGDCRSGIVKKLGRITLLPHSNNKCDQVSECRYILQMQFIFSVEFDRRRCPFRTAPKQISVCVFMVHREQIEQVANLVIEMVLKLLSSVLNTSQETTYLLNNEQFLYSFQYCNQVILLFCFQFLQII